MSDFEIPLDIIIYIAELSSQSWYLIWISIPPVGRYSLNEVVQKKMKKKFLEENVIEKFHQNGRIYSTIYERKINGNYENIDNIPAFILKDGDGKVLEERNYKHGKRHGPSKYYNIFGELTVIEYKDGKRHGLSKYFDKRGEFKKIIEYKDGERCLSKHYSRYGGIDRVSEYKDGKKHGKSIIRFGADEELVIYYNNGVPGGLKPSYFRRSGEYSCIYDSIEDDDEDSDIFNNRINQNEPVYRYVEGCCGEIMDLFYYNKSDGLLNGLYRHYIGDNPDKWKELKTEITFKDGLADGYYYTSTSKMRVEAYFKHGLLDGTYIENFVQSNGYNYKIICFYRKGELCGKYRKWIVPCGGWRRNLGPPTLEYNFTYGYPNGDFIKRDIYGNIIDHWFYKLGCHDPIDMLN